MSLQGPISRKINSPLPEAAGGAGGVFERAGAGDATAFAAHDFQQVPGGLARLRIGSENLDHFGGETVDRMERGRRSFGALRGDG